MSSILTVALALPYGGLFWRLEMTMVMVYDARRGRPAVSSREKTHTHTHTQPKWMAGPGFALFQPVDRLPYETGDPFPVLDTDVLVVFR